VPAATEQLERILASRLFRESPRLSAFLKFSVENSLSGRADLLKETVIAAEVFGRSVLDTKTDSIVRSAARRMRARLNEYYATDGADDRVRISIPVGTYRAEIEIVAAVVPAGGDGTQAERTTGWQNWLSQRLTAVITIAAAVSVLGVAAAFWVHHASSAAQRARSVTIVPFQGSGALGSGDENAWKTVEDDLARDLAHVPGLTLVTTAGAPQAAADGLRSLRARPDQLHVGAALSGTLLVKGPGWELTVTLRDTHNGATLWTRTFCLKREELPAVENQVLEQVAGQFGLHPAPGMHQPNMTVLDLFHSACLLTNKGEREAAIALLEQAVQRDPRFVPAQVWLGNLYASGAMNDQIETARALQRAERAAREALRYDPKSGEAHAVLGFVRYLQGRWREADQEFRLATTLAPNYAEAWHNWAYVDFAYGRFRHAEEVLETAIRLEPLSQHHPGTLAMIYFYQREYDRAIQFCRRGLAIDPSNFLLNMVFADSLVQQGKGQDAADFWQALVRRYPGQSAIAGRVAIYECAAGRSDALRRVVAMQRGPGFPHLTPWLLAQFYQELGQTQRSLEMLEQAAKEGDPDLISVRWDPLFDPLRREPKYRQVVGQLGFVERQSHN
jgi:tetratricopeptide (TPR) repeat protein